MGAGQFDITLDYLAQLLALPETAVVRAVVGDVEQQVLRRRVTIVVESPDLPSVGEGATIPEIRPEWSLGGLQGWGDVAGE